MFKSRTNHIDSNGNMSRKLNFRDVMVNHRDYGLPYFESVRRTRPKLQNKYPELRPSKEVQDARRQEEEDYREYALS